MPLSTTAAEPVRSHKFAAIDFESAGATRGRTDVPVQVGITLWCPQKGLGESFCSYLSSNQPISWSARKIHGITLDDLSGAPSLLSLYPQIRSLLKNRILIAHGHGTEKRFLRAFPGHQFGPWVDTLNIARAAWPGLAKFSLGDLIEHFDLTKRIGAVHPDRCWHDALYDATASAILLDHLITSLSLRDKALDLLLHPDLSIWKSLRPT
tara:strand:- start:2471 stop:3097 length:627 start_codon:yes stop_codon:yes gene_type:complete